MPEPDDKNTSARPYRAEDGVRDGAALIGLGLIAAGLWMRDPALALIVTGSLLLAYAVVGAWMAAR